MPIAGVDITWLRRVTVPDENRSVQSPCSLERRLKFNQKRAQRFRHRADGNRDHMIGCGLERPHLPAGSGAGFDGWIVHERKLVRVSDQHAARVYL